MKRDKDSADKTVQKDINMDVLFEYKCVPVPRSIGTGIVGKDIHNKAIYQYQQIINDACIGGWEFVQVDNITSYQKPGCLAGIFGAKGEEINYKLLIFKRNIK